MKKQERANYVAKTLADLYPDPPIPLDHSDSFTLLIAVLLSAQCTDKKVNEVTPGLFKVAKTPATMSKLTVARIKNLIRQYFEKWIWIRPYFEIGSGSDHIFTTGSGSEPLLIDTE